MILGLKVPAHGMIVPLLELEADFLADQDALLLWLLLCLLQISSGILIGKLWWGQGKGLYACTNENGHQ